MASGKYDKVLRQVASMVWEDDLCRAVLEFKANHRNLSPIEQLGVLETMKEVADHNGWHELSAQIIDLMDQLPRTLSGAGPSE